MNTDYTATRMLGYLYRYTNPKIEDLVDEMLAILSDRAQIIEKKEYSTASFTYHFSTRPYSFPTLFRI